jgi:putative ABC transport system permease protein
MTLPDLFHETSSAILANKVRSGLTILGIVIGIASVIAMLAIGNGAKGSITSSINSIGSNLVMVMPGAQQTPGSGVSAGRGTAQTLTMDDSTAIAGLSEAEAVAPSVTSRVQVTAKGTNTNTTVVGTTAAYSQVRNIQVSSGSFLSDENNTEQSKVAVLGPTTSTDLFGTDDPVGQQIRISGTDYTVIGETVSKGGSGFTNADDMIYIPISVAQQYLTGNKYVSTISIEADSSQDMTDLQNQITSLLLQRHNISDAANADFTVLNQSDILATASSVTNTLTYLLASVAGISLVVGGIGIMNMMLTTVTERTREIGLRKAIGAKKSDINTQFLVEAIMLTFSGGLIGTALGALIAWGVTLSGLTTATVSLSSVLLSFSVSAVIGIAFGYYPARRASEMRPIDALRFE